jgi:predicted nucleotidyltransferase
VIREIRKQLCNQGVISVESRKKLIEKLLDTYTADETVLGIIQIGSIVKCYDDEYSDVDLVLVVTEDKYATLEKNFQKTVHTEEYDLKFTTVDMLRDVKNSKSDEDHWDFQKAIVLLDKTNSLEEELREIVSYDTGSRLERLKRYYLGYWENTLNSLSCLEHNNRATARIYAAIAIQELIRLLFNLNRKWAPRTQWAFKEISFLHGKPANLESQIQSILEEPDSEEISELWNQTAELLKREKCTFVDHPEEIL